MDEKRTNILAVMSNIFVKLYQSTWLKDHFPANTQDRQSMRQLNCLCRKHDILFLHFDLAMLGYSVSILFNFTRILSSGNVRSFDAKFLR